MSGTQLPPGAGADPAGAGRRSEVTAILVSYRTAELSVGSVEALWRSHQASGLPDHVIVIDNDSGDAPAIASAFEAAGYGEWAEVVKAPRNGGFGYGNNLGMTRALARGPVRYFWLLNPDTVPAADAVLPLKRCLDENPGVGVVGGSCSNADGSSWPIAFRFPTPWSEFEQGVQWGLVTRLLRRYVVAREMPQSGVSPIDWVAGASMMMPARLAQQLEGFDESFFLYFEETDLCFRAAAEGFATWYVPASHVMHIAGASTQLTRRGVTPPRMPTYWFESRRRYFRLRYGLLGSGLVDLLSLAGLAIGSFKAALLRRPTGRPAHFLGDLLRNSVLAGRGWQLEPRRSGWQACAPAEQPRPAGAAATHGADGSPTRVAVVAIGRNEGPRLEVCLKSAQAAGVAAIVYVDSGSTDGSVALARSLGCEVVELDMRVPFTAARARNAGLARARERVPGLSHVQFVDGDCELDARWLPVALGHLLADPAIAAVCGRRRERHPERSIYNRLCDREWDTPVGRTKACGGDALFRADALAQVGGYNDQLIAGEEPDLCVRLRASGWQIWRLDAEMTLHDAAMLRFAQWWKRSKRAGYAFAQGAALHGAPPERHWVTETRRALLWGLAGPLAVAAVSLAWWPAGLLLALIYPLQALRLGRRMGLWPHGVFLTLAKFPEAAGVLQYNRDAWLGRRAQIIEYK
jgi:GT2 family glycosyltransferase